jgi:hypothetical protein
MSHCASLSTINDTSGVRDHEPSCKETGHDARLEVFMAVKIQVQVIWVVTPHSFVVGYQHFGGIYCLHLQ